MTSQLPARLVALAVLSLFASLGGAQEPAPPPAAAPPTLPETAAQVIEAITEPAPPAAVPEPPPVEGAPVAEPPATAPEADAVVAEEALTEEGAAPDALAVPPEPTAGVAASGEPKRILVLPLEFTVYEKSVAGMEAVPDWTEAARRNLLEAAGSMLRADSRFEIVAVPPVEGQAQDVLREHVELFKIISDTVTGVVHMGGKAWEEKKTNFDYTLGNGLAFLADASGADYAFILGGAQVKPTGGSTFMQLLAAGAAGVYVTAGGTFVAAGIVELRTGNVTWLNSMQGGELFGMTTNDTRKPEAATAILAKMFEGYPATRWVTIRAF